MAPAATLKSYPWWFSAGEALTDYTFVINSRDARISNNSWGYGPGDPATESACNSLNGAYWAECTTIDNIVRGAAGEPITIVKSAGNARATWASDECGSIGWTWNTVAPWETSKNIICVGAINSDNSVMTAFSSWGPCDDGRIKPDVVGPGCKSTGGIRSLRLGSGYTDKCGTSMSSPAVAGAVALLYERWDNVIGGSSPLPSTVKGLLINSAEDLGSAGPDYAYGHGKVDIAAAVDDKLKVSIVWDDPGGSSSSSQHLINDIDLELLDPFSGVEEPWILNPDQPFSYATKGIDRKNNVETVEIDNPSPGLWKARVSGYNIPQGPQPYSLVFTPNGISTPGNLSAVAVLEDGDLEVLPDEAAAVRFWVANVGATEDTVAVSISDDAGWLTSTMTDSIIALSPWDSSEFVLEAVVPAAALAGEYTIVSCAAVSQVHVGIDALNEIEIVADAYYGVALTPPPFEVVNSPDTVQFNVTVANTGNDTDLVSIELDDDSGWTIIPDLRGVTLDPGQDSSMSFTIIVPAEVPDGALNFVTIDAAGNNGGLDQTTYDIQISNPYPPPALVLPEDYTYARTALPTFEWSGPADHYTLYISNDALITDIVRSYTGLSSTIFTLPGGDELPDGGYFWAVRLFVGAESSSLQRYSRKFVVDNIAPHNVLPDEPIGGVYVGTDLPDFGLAWETTPADPGWETSPEIFFVEASQDPSFAGTVTTIGPSESLVVHGTFPMDQGRWYWRAYALDSAGNASDTSTSTDFLLDSEDPATPTLVFPSHGTMVSGDTVLLKWFGTPGVAWETAPEYFYIHVSKESNFSDYTFANYTHDGPELKLPASLLLLDQMYYWRVKAFDSAGQNSPYSDIRSFTYTDWICGDIDGDAFGPDISDILFVARYALLGGAEPPNLSAADVTCDGFIDISDILAVARRALLDGEPLCCE
jgi:hypothetical protein